MDTALQQLERSTGMKAVILIGGPTPVATGDMTTHVYAIHPLILINTHNHPSYETGRSRANGLRFSENWEGFEGFHDEFVNWLRSVYCGWFFLSVGARGSQFYSRCRNRSTKGFPDHVQSPSNPSHHARPTYPLRSGQREVPNPRYLLSVPIVA